jgi:hypothetical protein
MASRPSSAHTNSQEGVLGAPAEADDDLVDYCSRPACRREFRRTSGPGRRQAYCSEVCRRAVDREYRKTTQRLAHFEGVVEQLRADVAAFGRSIDTDAEPPGTVSAEGRRLAEDAVVRAGGVVAFLRNSDDPIATELRTLYEAVAPVLRR